MVEKNWKYKIGQDKVAVVLMAIMAAVFVALATWMYKTKNGAFFFGALIAGVMVLVLLLVVHRFIFYKVWIASDGFYYQINSRNGRFYDYRELEKAWISSGTAQNGGEHYYCNIAVYGKPVLRFQFFLCDEEAVEYLVNRTEEVSLERARWGEGEKEAYLIDGKTFGKMSLGVSVAMSAFLIVSDVIFVSAVKWNLVSVCGVGLTIATIFLLFNSYFFFQVKIEKEGFYCRTNPFNGHYYAYEEIRKCHTIRKVVRHRRKHQRGSAGERRYYFFFVFVDANGKKRKFQYSEDVYEQEIRVLKERIEKMYHQG